MKKPELVVTALGGGPGSDTIGVVKYLQASGDAPRVLFYLCDREPLWSETWGDLGMKLSADLNLNTAYLPHDALDPGTWRTSKKYLQADLFTMVFFISELYKDRTQAEPYFDHVFQNAKSGAFLLFIDNNSPIFYDWFDTLWQRNGLQPAQGREGMAKMPLDEQKDVLAKYTAKFGGARLNANVAYRVLYKP